VKGAGKKIWKGAKFMGKVLKKHEPIPMTFGGVMSLTFGVLVILTVAFLYILGLFLEVGGWLGSIIDLITFIINSFSRLFFRGSLPH
jgi:hypothetical protein